MAAELARLSRPNAASLRAVRRKFSSELASESGAFVTEVALTLLGADVPGRSVVAYELIRHHPDALSRLGPSEIQRLGTPMGSWGDVDTFACYVSGQAWRNGQVSNALIHRWARSPGIWWRRAALVSTVPLNVKSQGGTGDPVRTLAVCKLLISDHEHLVVQALSWALRALAVREPQAVQRFLSRYKGEIAARVLREVKNKIETGRKNP